MNYAQIRRLREKFYFTAEDVSELLGIKPQSAWVLCSRYAAQGVFVRLKNNFYVLDERWLNFTREQLFGIANYLQVPSYISFMTALSYYEVSTQAQNDFFESASLRRSVRFEARGTAFNFYKLKKELYFDFSKKGAFFIAGKEKAFLDSMYLFSFGKYKIDTASLDFAKLEKKKIKGMLGRYPAKTKRIVEKVCRI